MGLEVILYVYLAGWAGMSTYGVYICQEDQRVITKNECRTIAVLGGSLWPAAVYFMVDDAIDHRRLKQNPVGPVQ